MKPIARPTNKGFTLIELLVVIAIISMLSTIVLGSLNQARLKARTVRSLADLRTIRMAIEMYYIDNGTYPASSGGWGGLYTCWGTASTNWIQGLVPTYLPTLPREPLGTNDCDKQYIYSTNGTDYKLIWHNPENMSHIQSAYPHLVDPNRPYHAYGYWTPGFQNN